MENLAICHSKCQSYVCYTRTMTEQIVGLIHIFLSALTPIGELRLAIPLGLTQYDYSVVAVYLAAVIGNMLPPILILYAAPPIVDWLRKQSKQFDKLMTWVFERTRKKTEKAINKYGPLGLILFVAIPFPTTGAWTGSLAAWLFGIEKKQALRFIFVGVVISGIIMTLLTRGVQFGF